MSSSTVRSRRPRGDQVFLQIPKGRADLSDMRLPGPNLQVIADEVSLDRIEAMMASGNVPDALRGSDRGLRAEFNLKWWQSIVYGGPAGIAYLLASTKACPADAASAVILKSWSPAMIAARAKADGNFNWAGYTSRGATRNGSISALVNSLVQQGVLMDAVKARIAAGANFVPKATWSKGDHILRVEGVGPLSGVLQVPTDQPVPQRLLPYKAVLANLAAAAKVSVADLKLMGLKDVPPRENVAVDEAVPDAPRETSSSKPRHGRNLFVQWRNVGKGKNRAILVTPNMLVYGTAEAVAAAIVLYNEMNLAAAPITVPSARETLLHLVIRFFYGWEEHVWAPASSIKALLDPAVVAENDATSLVRPRLTYAVEVNRVPGPIVGFEMEGTPGHLIAFIDAAEKAFSPAPLEYAGVTVIYDPKRARVFMKVDDRFVPGSARSVLDELPAGVECTIYSLLAYFAGVPTYYLKRMRPEATQASNSAPAVIVNEAVAAV